MSDTKDNPEIIAGLREFADQLEQMKSGDRSSEYARFFSDMERLKDLACLPPEKRIEYEVLMSRLSGMHGLKARVRDTMKLIQKLNDRAVQAANEALAQVQAGRTLQEVLPDYLYERLPVLHIPPQWDLSLQGVFSVTVDAQGNQNKEKIATAPIIILKRGRDIETGHQQVELAWVEFAGPDGGQPAWRTKTVDRATAFDSRNLNVLIGYGAPITSVNIHDIIRWFTAFEDANMNKIPLTAGTRRMGWQPDGSFMLPDTHIRKVERAKLSLFPEEGMEPVMAALHTRGSYEGWISVVNLLRDHPLAMISIYASLAAPLARFVGCSNFCVDWSNETSTGKTTSLRVAASVWGNPDEKADDGFIYTWNVTKVYVERLATFLQSLPVILDETKTVQDSATVGKMVYDFCIGRGKGRGTIKGVDEGNTWNTVLLSTGEQKLSSFTKDGGVQGRVIALTGAPISGPSHTAREVANSVKARLLQHYGHFGRQFVEYLVHYWDDRESFAQIFKDYREQYADVTNSRVGGRLAEYVALIQLAKLIAENLGLPKPAEGSDPVPFLIQTLRDSLHGSDMPREAFVQTVAWAASAKNQFYGSTANPDGRYPTNGYVGAWRDSDPRCEFIAFDKARLTHLLSSWGFKFEEVIRGWNARGWLFTRGGRRIDKNVSIDGVMTQCICLSQSSYLELIEAERPDIAHEEKKNRIASLAAYDPGTVEHGNAVWSTLAGGEIIEYELEEQT